MDETPAERITTRITEMVLGLALVWLAQSVPASLPFVTGTIGAIFGRAAGATIATRVRTNTVRRLGGGGGGAGGSMSPPGGGSGSPPPPPPSALARVALAFGVAWAAVSLAALLVVSCAAAKSERPPTALEAAYSAELLSCVAHAQDRDASQACRADVDRIFAPLLDGGPSDGGALERVADVSAESR